MYFFDEKNYFFSFQLTISIKTQTTATIKISADIPNNMFETSGIDIFIAEATIEIIKSNIIAIFFIKTILDIVVCKKQLRSKNSFIKINFQMLDAYN